MTAVSGPSAVWSRTRSQRRIKPVGRHRSFGDVRHAARPVHPAQYTGLSRLSVACSPPTSPALRIRNIPAVSAQGLQLYKRTEFFSCLFFIFMACVFGTRRHPSPALPPRQTGPRGSSPSWIRGPCLAAVSGSLKAGAESVSHHYSHENK